MVFSLYNLGPAYAVKGNVVNVSHSLESVCACLRNVVIVAHGPGFACAVQRIVAKVPRTRRLGSVCAIKDHAANVSNTIGSVFAVTHNGAYTSRACLCHQCVCVFFLCVDSLESVYAIKGNVVSVLTVWSLSHQVQCGKCSSQFWACRLCHQMQCDQFSHGPAPVCANKCSEDNVPQSEVCICHQAKCGPCSPL